MPRRTPTTRSHREAPGLLEQPASEAAARIVRERLGKAARCLERLVAADDDEALHDFRVAVRRTRSALRAYRDVLGSRARKKDHRRLRDISRATNAGRDAEVQIGWLVAHRSHLPRDERGGLSGLLRALRRERRAGWAEGRSAVRPRFRKASARLRRHLQAPAAASGPLRPAFGTLLAEHARGLASLLASVRTVDDRDELHEARIAAKRLRYLLEPMVGELAEARSAIRALKDLQELLGEQRDLDLVIATLQARAPDDPGLQTLARLAETERDACWTRLGDTWLSPASGGPAFLATLDDLGSSLAGPPPSASPDPRRRGVLGIRGRRVAARRAHG